MTRKKNIIEVICLMTVIPFIDGLRLGHGAVTKPDGSTYVGQFSNDKRDGQGVRNYADGSKENDNINCE